MSEGTGSLADTQDAKAMMQYARMVKGLGTTAAKPPPAPVMSPAQMIMTLANTLLDKGLAVFLAVLLTVVLIGASMTALYFVYVDMRDRQIHELELTEQLANTVGLQHGRATERWRRLEDRMRTLELECLGVTGARSNGRGR